MILMTIRILPPDEAAKKAKERVAEWKRQREIDAAKARIEERTLKMRLGIQLIEAAKQGDTELMKRLIERGADVKAKCEKGWTALMWTSSNGCIEIAEMMIENGADVNARSSIGFSALICAVMENQTNTAEMLIKRGADVNARSDDGKTALWWTMTKGRNTDMVELLIKHGAVE